MQDLVDNLTKRYLELQAKRSGFHSQYQEIQRYVRPNSSSFSLGGDATIGETQHKDMFDSTACWACDQFANGLHSSVTNPSERWFQIAVAGVKTEKLSRNVRAYLDDVSDAIYYHYSLSESAFTSALHENYQDLGAFGTDILYQDWNPNTRSLVFIPVSLGEAYIDENVYGLIDTVFRVKQMPLRNLLQLFPDAADRDGIKGQDPQKTYTLIHSVYPREDWRYGLSKTDKPFASVYWSPDVKGVFSESGYDTLPYHVSRWTKQTGEVYGRGPGMSVLNSIRYLVQMKKELMVSAQLLNRPPIVADEDSLLVPVGKKGVTIAPGSLLYKTMGAEMPQPLLSGSQPNFSLEMIESERDAIRRAFYVDFLIREKKKERQSVLEIQDERGEMMRQMAPMCGRIETEKLGPMISRSYQLLNKHRMLPEMPAEIRGQRLALTYTSPVARAQLGAKGLALQGLVQDLTSIGSIFPQIFSHLDENELLNVFVEARGVPTKVIKSAEQQQKEAQAQAQAQQAQMMMEAAPQMGKALKDVAQARQIDPSMTGLLQ